MSAEGQKPAEDKANDVAVKYETIKVRFKSLQEQLDSTVKQLADAQEQVWAKTANWKRCMAN